MKLLYDNGFIGIFSIIDRLMLLEECIDRAPEL